MLKPWVVVFDIGHKRANPNAHTSNQQHDQIRSGIKFLQGQAVPRFGVITLFHPFIDQHKWDQGSDQAGAPAHGLCDK